MRVYRAPLLIAGLAWLFIVSHLDPAGSYPGMPAGPGLTVDETFNVQQGVILVEACRAYGVGLLAPEALQEVFSPPLHLPDHPPLGRFWLGVHHHLAWWWAPPLQPEGPFVTACARAGSATAFALTLLLVGCCATAWYGEWAGVMTSLACVLMPRWLGHAHLAALESMTNLTCTAALLAVVAWWHLKPPPSFKVAVLTGGVLGLALLTKIQAVLVPIPVIVWACWRWRERALLPLIVWGGTGCLVFFLGWPWLWLNPVEHLTQYLRGATDRAALSVWLAGEKYTDKTAPFYYPALYFWWTIPLTLQFLGGVGCLGKGENATSSEQVGSWLSEWWSPREGLLVTSALWPLCFFGLPGVPVYDCERLWLTALPLWAVLVGRGSAIVWRWGERWWENGTPYFVPMFLGVAVLQIVTTQRFAPMYLSYYSGTTWGMTGVAHWNLERNYWGDAITRTLLEDVVRTVPSGSEVAMTPVLHQFQTEELWRQSPILRQHGCRIVPYDPEHQSHDYVLLFARDADLPNEFHGDHPQWEAVCEVEVGGVPLAGLYRRRLVEVTAADPGKSSPQRRE